MWQIFSKELNSFFSAVLGYLVVSVFLVMMGLFVWVFPQTSVLEGSYASLDTLFNIAPYVFMFLLPAITMRGLAEEKKTGTLELLFTRPLTDTQIVVGKFLAAWATALLALILPQCSILQMGNNTTQQHQRRHTLFPKFLLLVLPHHGFHLWQVLPLPYIVQFLNR